MRAIKSGSKKPLSILMPLIFVLLACAPGAAPGGGQGATSSEQAQKPKILNMASLSKVATLDGWTGQGGTRGGADMLPMVNDYLTATDQQGVVQPLLATTVPTIANGLWQILPDGGMTMTWKLRENAKWHDGAPFTADDMVFTLQLFKDPALAHAEREIANLMESATAIDPHTVMVKWKSVYVEADKAPAFRPNAKHYLEADYQGDKDAFVNSAKYRDEYIGTGPYRISSWPPGVQMELQRFDDYWQGRPLIDRIILNFVGDANTVTASILAGAIELIMPPAVTPEAAAEVKQRWEGTGNVVRIEPVETLDYMEPMIRPEFAKPVNGMPQVLVRQAMMHAIDRKALADVITLGLGPVADNHLFPGDATYPQVESASVKYPYDPTRAKQLLAQAGWEAGLDGVLVHRPSSEKFETQIMVNQTLAVRMGTIIADDWKRVGIVAAPDIITPALSTDREYQAKRPGPYATYAFGTPGWNSDRLNGKDIASDANRWSGRNRVGFQNARADELLDLLRKTIEPSQRLPLLREQTQIYTGEVALMPLYWEVRTSLALKSVKAEVRPGNPYYNTFSWDKDPG
jgi:peptide/nickel transport system substrate-binding protein